MEDEERLQKRAWEVEHGRFMQEEPAEGGGGGGGDFGLHSAVLKRLCQHTA